MKLMLDTSAYSAFKRSHPGVIVAIRQADEILLPSTVHGELLAGFETGSRTEENRGSLNEFLQSPRVKLVPAGTETAEHYARIYAYLRSLKAFRSRPTISGLRLQPWSTAPNW